MPISGVIRYMLTVMSTRLLDVGTLTPIPGEVSYMLLWKTTMLGVETLLIYGEFWSLLEVGTLTPNPVQVRFMLV